MSVFFILKSTLTSFERQMQIIMQYCLTKSLELILYNKTVNIFHRSESGIFINLMLKAAFVDPWIDFRKSTYLSSSKSSNKCATLKP